MSMKYFHIKVYTGWLPGLGQHSESTSDEICLATNKGFEAAKELASEFCLQNARLNEPLLHSNLSFDEWWQSLYPYLSREKAKNIWDIDLYNYYGEKAAIVKEVSQSFWSNTKRKKLYIPEEN